MALPLACRPAWRCRPRPRRPEAQAGRGAGMYDTHVWAVVTVMAGVRTRAAVCFVTVYPRAQRGIKLAGLGGRRTSARTH